MSTPTPSDSWIVFQVRCADGRHHAGATRDLERTLYRHATGQFNKTRGSRPVELVYCHATSFEATHNVLAQLFHRPFDRCPNLPEGMSDEARSTVVQAVRARSPVAAEGLRA